MSKRTKNIYRRRKNYRRAYINAKALQVYQTCRAPSGECRNHPPESPMDSIATRFEFLYYEISVRKILVILYHGDFFCKDFLHGLIFQNGIHFRECRLFLPPTQRGDLHA